MCEKGRRGVVLSALLFTLYIFVFLLTEFTVNVRCGKLLGGASVTTVYSVGIVCTSIGYAGFFLSRRLIKNEDKRRLLISVLAVAYLCLTLCFMFTAAQAVFIISTLSALWLFGYIGGFTHYITALFLFGLSCSGKIVGLAVAAATLLQFVVQNLLITDTALVISLALSVFAILYLAMKPVRDGMFENPLPYSAKPTVTGKSFLLPVCVVAVMSMSFGLGDGIVTQLHASGTVNLASYLLTQREAEILTILLDSEATNKDIAGELFVSTRVLERYITAIYEKTGTETRVGLINLYYGKKAAPDDASPNLISVLPSVSESESQEQAPPVITKVQPKQPVTLSPVNELSPEKSALAAERYSLTRREVEMLRFLYLGKTNEQIAAELVISENTVKFHVKNLMRKLSVSSRAEVRDVIDLL